MDTSEMRKQKEGTKKRKKLRSQRDGSSLGSPSEEEVRVRRVTHVPFRDWCPDCVAGRDKDWQHQSRNSQETLTVPEVHLDCCFIREAAGKDFSVVPEVKDRETKLILAHIVPFKGGDTEWVSEQVCRDLHKLIRSDVVYKSNQEPALVQLVKQVSALRPSSRWCLTHSGLGRRKETGCAVTGRDD